MDDTVLERERAHARPLAPVGGPVGAAGGREPGDRLRDLIRVERLIAQGKERPLRLAEIDALLASGAFVVDACRHAVRDPQTVVPLARRPVLFALALARAEAWPEDVARDTLVASTFRAWRADDSHRARLRVEIGRLRTALRTLSGVGASQHTAQRALDALAARGKVQSFGRG